MAQTITKTIYVHVNPCEHSEDGYALGFYEFDGTNNIFDNRKPSIWGHCIGKTMIQIELPDGIDLRKVAAEQLEQAKSALSAEYQARITQIDGQIQRLLALESA